MTRWPIVNGPVAVDTETTGGLHPDPPECARVAVVSIAWHEGKRIQAEAFPFAFGAGRGAQPTLALDEDPNLPEAEWWSLLEWLATHRLIMHGSKFDSLMLGVGTDQFEGVDLTSSVVWDTMLASRDLDATVGADLEQLEQRWGDSGYLTNKQRSEWLASKRKRGEVNKMPWPQARRYAATDAEVTYAAFEEQHERYDTGEGNVISLRKDLELAKALLSLERRGIAYDANGSKRAAATLRKAEAKIAKGLPFRATVHGAKLYYFKQLGLESASETATGQPRLDDQEVARLVSQGAPFAEEYQRYAKIKHARTAWYEPYAEMSGWDGRLRTSYSQAKVVSGRLSSTRVNLQAIPHEYQLEQVIELGIPQPRDLFKPAPGKRLWELDLSQAELRVAAIEADCTPMLELLQAGADMHGEVARQLFNDEPGSPTWPKNRQVSKRADFSFIFGVGADTFQRDLAKQTGIYLTLHECNQIVNRWRRLYPHFKRAIYRYMEQANHWGYIRLVNGRVRHFSQWKDHHEAFNQYVQGSLAELMNEWLLTTEREHPGLCLLTIHDSLVLETNQEADVAAVAGIGAKLGTEMFGVQMVVDTKEWRAVRQGRDLYDHAKP